MAKKKFTSKNVKIDATDLAVTKIGEMPSADKSPIFIIFVFGIFILFVFFLPDVVGYFNKDEGGTISSTTENKKSEGEILDEQEITYYDISSTLSIDLDGGLVANNFKLADSKLSFDITNNGISKYYFSKKNYFAELYSSDNTLIERVILDKDSVAKDTTKSYSYSLFSSNVTNITKISFITKDISDYPAITLNDDKLICSNKNESITYEFKEDKLVKINDSYTYLKPTSEILYQNDVSSWQNKVAKYNTLNGVTSTFTASSTGFVVDTTIDLKEASISNFESDYYYEYETLAKVVSFEMAARGFNCN